MKNDDKLILGGKEFSSRFILGSGKYSLSLIEAAVRDAGAEIITLAVRRANTKEHENILDYIPEGVTLLPNTSGIDSEIDYELLYEAVLDDSNRINSHTALTNDIVVVEATNYVDDSIALANVTQKLIT